MIAAIIICLVLGSIFGLGLLFGAIIHMGHPITEEPMPFEPEVDLHREIHSSRWSV